MKKIGRITEKLNTILNSQLPLLDIYQSNGVKSHIINRHPNCEKYFDEIPNIINHPDYIGQKNNNAIEFIKIYDKNIMVAVKLDTKNDYFYIASLYDVTADKIERRVRKGLIKKV